MFLRSSGAEVLIKDVFKAQNGGMAPWLA